MMHVSRRVFLAGTGATGLGIGTLPVQEWQPEPPIDVFLVAGQSNAMGRGDAEISPDVPRGFAYEYTGSDIEPLDDPVGWSFEDTDQAQTGSAWPAFGLGWFFYGRTCALVPVARKNTAQVDDADSGDGNWDSSGELRYTASDATNEAVAWLSEEGYDPTVRGVVWVQGERDAAAIDQGRISKDDYEEGLAEMIDFYREEIGVHLPFYINQTGRREDHDTGGYRDVREAQAEIASSDADSYLATDFAEEFPDEGLMANQLHYTQKGYDLLGYYSAKAVYESQFRPWLS